jgi:hypothetical protein
MSHPFQCRCGALQGEVAEPGQGVRAVCYCKDCQAYARLLGEPQRVLDALGGTDMVATQSTCVRFTAGVENLACLSLSPRGLLRWYASCCGTPIANTPRDWRLPYAGMVHTALRQPQPLERSFPRVQMQVNTKSAHGKPPPVNKVAGMARLARLMLRLAAARLRGRHTDTPFFDTQGKPVVEVTVAPREAVEAARRAS